MHQHFLQQCNDSTAIHQVIHFENSIIRHISVILVTAGSWNTQFKDMLHRDPAVMLLRISFSRMLFRLKSIYILAANSILRFM